MDSLYYTSTSVPDTTAQDDIMASLTPPPTVDPSTTTIKMEDLHQAPFADTPAPSHSVCASSPAPSTQEGKAVKKRKSWGQVLPEPKTNLPPRKRAKTEDEKEQRRIERVKRNRLAAHNSRERKRQEYELLQAEKDQMEQDLLAARRQIAQMTTELKAYRQKYPGQVPEADVDLDNAPVSDYTSFTSPDTVNPAKTTASTGFPSPDSMTMDSFDSPRDSSCAPETPNFSESAVDFDQTRYPAEILCDLQCRSTSASTDSLSATWAFLSLFNLTLPWTSSLLKTFSTSISSPTTRWDLLRALLTTTPSSLPASSMAPTLPTLTFLTTLMQSTSTCRQPLAQPLLATRLSQRSANIDEVARSLEGVWRASLDGGMGRRLRSYNGSEQSHLRRQRSETLRREGFQLLNSVRS